MKKISLLLLSVSFLALHAFAMEQIDYAALKSPIASAEQPLNFEKIYNNLAQFNPNDLIDISHGDFITYWAYKYDLEVDKDLIILSVDKRLPWYLDMVNSAMKKRVRDFYEVFIEKKCGKDSDYLKALKKYRKIEKNYRRAEDLHDPFSFTKKCLNGPDNVCGILITAPLELIISCPRMLITKHHYESSKDELERAIKRLAYFENEHEVLDVMRLTPKN